MNRPILLIGIPRSGTSWIGKALSRIPDVRYVQEPDNEKLNPMALRGKRKIQRFPILTEGDRCRDYRHLWQAAFTGFDSRGPRSRMAARLFNRASREDLERAVAERSLTWRLHAACRLQPWAVREHTGKRIVVKTVHAPLALEWLARNFDFDPVIVLRHPLNVLASWLHMCLPDRDRRLYEDPRVVARYVSRLGLPTLGEDGSDVARAAWQVGLLTTALHETLERHSEWKVAVHEKLCVDMEAGFRTLVADLGLDWNDRIRDYLDASNRPGTGFRTARVASDLPEKWRTRLSRRQLAEARGVLNDFPGVPTE